MQSIVGDIHAHIHARRTNNFLRTQSMYCMDPHTQLWWCCLVLECIVQANHQNNEFRSPAAGPCFCIKQLVYSTGVLTEGTSENATVHNQLRLPAAGILLVFTLSLQAVSLFACAIGQHGGIAVFSLCKKSEGFTCKLFKHNPHRDWEKRTLTRKTSNLSCSP